MRELSKGMKTQVHLALTMAIDAKLLVLDEPTLGLDILARSAFYDALVNDYMDETRTILITTHQVEEVENLLTDVLFIDKGRIVLDSSLDDIATRYAAVAVAADLCEAARAEKPFYERRMLGKVVLYFEQRRSARSSRDSARSIPRASPIYSSPSCREVWHEHRYVAGTPGILGKPRDLADPRRVRRTLDPGLAVRRLSGAGCPRSRDRSNRACRPAPSTA